MRARQRFCGSPWVLSRARGGGALFSVSFDADFVQFADGGRFPRDTMLTTSVDQPYRLDVLCFLAQFASRYPGVVNAAAYLKARARSRVCVCALPPGARSRWSLLPVRACAGGSQCWCGNSGDY